MWMDWAARALLSPLLIAQALKVRRTAQSLPEAAGPRAGVVGHGPTLHLRLIGDSSAAGVGVAHQSEALIGQLVAELAPHFTVHWHLDALTGATTASTLSRLAQVDAHETDIIITALGVNDITRLIPPTTWQRQQDTLLARIRTLYAPRAIYVSAIPPVGQFPLLPNPLRWTLGRQAQAFEMAQRTWVPQQPDATLVPFDQPMDPSMMASDGFHPSAPIYRLWGKEMASRILSDWPKP
jgi:lysophospholipase L1-like esterase